MNKVLLLISLIALSGVETASVRGKSKIRTVFDPSQLRTFKMPQSCKNESKEFCFDNENYPTDIVEDIFDENNEGLNRLVVAAGDDYISRSGFSPFENECPAWSTNQIIYYIVDELGKDRVVVQMKGRFQQRFTVKWCQQEGPMLRRTKHFTKRMVLENGLYCRTEYMNYDFFVLSTEPGYDGKWLMEKARTKTGIPVCCTCRYDKNNS